MYSLIFQYLIISRQFTHTHNLKKKISTFSKISVCQKCQLSVITTLNDGEKSKKEERVSAFTCVYLCIFNQRNCWLFIVSLLALFSYIFYFWKRIHFWYKLGCKIWIGILHFRFIWTFPIYTLFVLIFIYKNVTSVF